MGGVRLRLDLGYDGTGFHGWAVQPAQRTVQAELEAALATQRQWLAQAGGSSAPAAPAASSAPTAAPAKKKSTSGWVRAE